MDQNFETASKYIRSAARDGADLAVLPEYHLLGWLPQDSEFKEACSHWQTYLIKYQDLATECQINIVPGTILELHDAGSEDEKLLNVAYFITPEGEIAGRYVKKNLWGPVERLHLTSSADDPHPVFDTPLGKIGMLICWDLAFPEAFREMIVEGAKIIIVPTFWLATDCSEEGRKINPDAEQLFLNSILTTRCFENTCGT
jgi:predicted amidohydrolase